MYYLISIQGKYAVHYRFKEHSAQSFKGLIQGITGKCCAVISSRFRTDLIYCTDEKLLPKEALKLWSVNLKEEFNQKQRHLFVFRSGKKEVLDYYFSSLNKLSNIADWYDEYLEEFNRLLVIDHQNPVLNLIATCDAFLVSNNYANNRTPLVNKLPDQSLEKMDVSGLLREMLNRPENYN